MQKKIGLLFLLVLMATGCSTLQPNERIGLRTDGLRMSSDELYDVEVRVAQKEYDLTRFDQSNLASFESAYAQSFQQAKKEAQVSLGEGKNISSLSSDLLVGTSLIDIGGRALGVAGTPSFGLSGSMFLLGILTAPSNPGVEVFKHRLANMHKERGRIMVQGPIVKSSANDIQTGADLRRGFLSMASWLEKTAGSRCTPEVFTPKGSVYGFLKIKGYSHNRAFVCEDFPQSAGTTRIIVESRRITKNHPLGQSNHNDIVSVVNLAGILPYGSKPRPITDPNYELKVFEEIQPSLENGVVMVFTKPDANGKTFFMVGDNQSVLAYEPLSTPTR